MDYAKESLKKHAEWGGKIEMISRAPIENRADMAVAYTPGVAAPCLEIEKDETPAPATQGCGAAVKNGGVWTMFLVVTLWSGLRLFEKKRRFYLNKRGRER